MTIKILYTRHYNPRFVHFLPNFYCDGKTKVQVTRDLQCPVSTVSSWWHRRASIVPELATEVNSETIEALRCHQLETGETGR